MSPAATNLFTAVTFATNGSGRYGYARIPAGTPGVVINDDWDALGMRASGSHSITSRASSFRSPPCAAASRSAARALHGEQPHRRALPRLGVARDRRDRPAGRGSEPSRRRPRRDAGRRERDRARPPPARRSPARDADRRPLRRQPDRDRNSAGSDRVFAEAQATKTFVNEASVRVVDRALALPAAPATSTATRSRAPTATSAPGRSCTRSAPTGRTTSSASVALGLEPSLH